ncbi:MAG: hypothetical protein HOW73_46895 [Polyangiaceae bacterium]|nr:hypothetical protein [Polyangiaceae bacterium]
MSNIAARKSWIATIAAGVLAGACSQKTETAPTGKPTSAAPAASSADQVFCGGVNDCTAKSECKTAKHECAGKNDCKGQGIVKMTADDCKAKGGKVEPRMM